MISVMPRILKDDHTAQEFVNELNIAEDYKEPAKRKYNEKSFYFNAFCRLFFCSIIRHVVFPFGFRKRRKNEKYRCRKYNGNKNQRNEKSSRNVTGAVSGTDGNEQTDGLKMGIWSFP